MNNDKLVVRCKDRTLLKGNSVDFDSKKLFFSMRLLSGEQVKIHVEDLKAVFIVKDYTGNEDYTYSYKDVLIWGGIKIRITFNDSEVMIGYISYHINGDQGFFVTPADVKVNNKSVYVIKSSTKDITYL